MSLFSCWSVLFLVTRTWCFSSATLLVVPETHGLSSPVGHSWESTAEADLLSHILQMCPYVWQDQYNLHEKGGTPVDMHSLLLSLEAIKRIWGQERSEKSNASCNKKALHSKKKGTKRSGTEATARVPKKARTKKHCDLCKKHGGGYTTHNTRDCRQFEKDRTEKIRFLHR